MSLESFYGRTYVWVHVIPSTLYVFYVHCIQPIFVCRPMLHFLFFFYHKPFKTVLSSLYFTRMYCATFDEINDDDDDDNDDFITVNNKFYRRNLNGVHPQSEVAAIAQFLYRFCTECT